MRNEGFVRIRKWDHWQTYRRDRGQPPWIKVHRELMRNPDWVALTDGQRGQLVSLWILAADRNGEIPNCPRLLQKLCYMDEPPDLQVLAERGFIQNDEKSCRHDDVTVTPRRRQRDAPEAEAETEEETDTSKPPVADLWSVWCSELGGSGRKPALTPKRKKVLTALYTEQLADYPDPIAQFNKILRAVKASDHHMSKRAYQMPESLFVNAERRDRWAMEADEHTEPEPMYRSGRDAVWE